MRHGKPVVRVVSVNGRYAQRLMREHFIRRLAAAKPKDLWRGRRRRYDAQRKARHGDRARVLRSSSTFWDLNAFPPNEPAWRTMTSRYGIDHQPDIARSTQPAGLYFRGIPRPYLQDEMQHYADMGYARVHKSAVPAGEDLDARAALAVVVQRDLAVDANQPYVRPPATG